MTPLSPGRTAQSFLDAVLDHGSFTAWTMFPACYGQVGTDYDDALTAAQARSGADEAIIVGEGTLFGHRVAIVVSEFSFLAGSIGGVAAERLVRAVERATVEQLPLIAAPASGGTRMQEGTPAFVQMITIAAAVADHKAAGLPYLVYLRHPTTGGVLASWASQGHITFAEPGALIGFLGPRVYEALHFREFPPGVQVAENLHAHGLVDGVIEWPDVRDVFGRVLTMTTKSDRDALPPTCTPTDEAVELGDTSAWDSIARSRTADRPGLRALLGASSDVVRLSGTGAGESAPGIIVALTRIGSHACVCIGHDRDREQLTHSVGPAALRAARRGIRLADQLRLPIVTVIDTPGARLSVEAEEGGLAGEISRCLTDLVQVTSPTVALILGQGAGGAALALLAADRVLACQHGWLSALPPEGASSIVYKTTARAPEVAAAQRVSSRHLRADGIVDRILVEDNDGSTGTETLCKQIAGAIAEELALLGIQPTDERLRLRRLRFRNLGNRAGAGGTDADRASSVSTP